MSLPSLMPPDVSAEGWRIDHLIHVTTAFIAVLAALGLAWLLYAAAFHRARPGRAPRYTRGTSRRAVALPLFAAAFLFFVVDGHMLITSTTDLLGVYLPAAADGDGALRVEVDAHQWAWEFRYAGRDGEFATGDDVAVTDHLVVPRDRRVVLEIASSDVVHSFHVPNLRVKRDAVPGRINRAGFTAVKTGDYDIVCAQFCGAHHQEMRATLTVLSEKEFAGWLADAAGDAERMEKEAQRARKEQRGGSERALFPEFRHRFGRHWGWSWK